jgi:hypothetical protein
MGIDTYLVYRAAGSVPRFRSREWTQLGPKFLDVDLRGFKRMSPLALPNSVASSAEGSRDLDITGSYVVRADGEYSRLADGVSKLGSRLAGCAGFQSLTTCLRIVLRRT